MVDGWVSASKQYSARRLVDTTTVFDTSGDSVKDKIPSDLLFRNRNSSTKTAKEAKIKPNQFCKLVIDI